MRIIRQPFRYQNNNAVYWLIGINVFVFAIMYFLGNKFYVMMEIDGEKYKVGLLALLAMIPERVIHGWVWTFVTYMFVHGGFTHILFNMLALFIFGIQVERYMGSREFLLFYFVTGVLAGVFSFGVYYFSAPNVPLLGASGAIFAVQLAFAVFYPDSIIYLWGILPLRAPVMVLGFTAIELFSSISSRNQSVAHLTHLAGFGFAWLYFVIRFRINPWKRLFNR